MSYLIQDINRMQKVVDTFLKDNGIDIKATVSLSKETNKAQWGRYRDLVYNAFKKEYYQDGEEYFKIELNDESWVNMGLANNAEHILNTLLHECIHHIAFHKNLDFNDGDYDFEKLLFEKGIDSNYENYELDELFHRQLKECESKEKQYFLDNDEYSVLKQKLMLPMSKARGFCKAIIEAPFLNYRKYHFLNFLFEQNSFGFS